MDLKIVNYTFKFITSNLVKYYSNKFYTSKIRKYMLFKKYKGVKVLFLQEFSTVEKG